MTALTAGAAVPAAAAGTAPLTWGQQAIWKAVQAMAAEDHVLNVRRVVPLPARRGIGVEGATAALRRLVAQHEALRTRISPAGGDLHQVLGPAGPLDVELVQVPAEPPDAPTRRLVEVHQAVHATPLLAAAADALVNRLATRSFAYADELPLRAGLLVVDGVVRQIVLVLSHLAVDWHAAEQVVRDLRLLLARGRLAEPAGLPAMDLARREQADTRRTERAGDYWADAYRRLPAELFTPVGPAADPPYLEVMLVSPALDRACALLAARHGVSSSTVLLAATAVLVGDRTGRTPCGLVTMVHNRFQQGHGEIIAPMSQLGLFVLDVGGAHPADPARLHDLVPLAWRQALAAYRHAYYDQVALDRALAAGGRGGGVQVDPYCCFNDIRAGGEVRAQGQLEAGALRDRLAESRLLHRRLDGFNWRCYVEVRDQPGALGYGLQADTRYLPPAELERFVLDLERYLVEAALS